MKRFLAIAIVLATLPALFADAFVIDNYEFHFEGKTDPSRVYEYLGLTDGASFESYDKLEEHVHSKAQDLVDSRIFTTVDYAIVEASGSGQDNPTVSSSPSQNEHHFHAVFQIDDKSPFFLFPTPKYDSNYGIKMGLRVDSKNLGGTLAQIQMNANMKQNDHSFEKAQYGLDFNVIGYPIAGFDFDASLSLAYNGNEGDLTGLSSDLAAKIYNVKVIDDVTFSLSSGIGFSPYKDELKAFGCNSFTYTAVLENMLKSIGGISLSHSLEYNPRKKTVSTDNYLYYYGFSLEGTQITTKLGLSSRHIQGDPFARLRASEYVEIPFTLPLGFSLAPSIEFYRNYTTDGTWDMLGWSVDKRIAVGLSLGRSSMRYVMEGNQDFREGMSLSISALRDMRLMDMLKDPFQYIQLQFSWFPYSNSWFNPSIRITGSLSSSSTKTILPSLADNDDPSSVADYMRGVRDDNGFNVEWSTKLVANINLTAKCIDLGSWARTYTIVFSDIAMLQNKDSNIKMLYTIGIEGIGIINSHPNYPVRASLGFNVESIKTYMKTKDIADLEYELFFGLNYFY